MNKKHIGNIQGLETCLSFWIFLKMVILTPLETFLWLARDSMALSWSPFIIWVHTSSVKSVPLLILAYSGAHIWSVTVCATSGVMAICMLISFAIGWADAGCDVAMIPAARTPVAIFLLGLKRFGIMLAAFFVSFLSAYFLAAMQLLSTWYSCAELLLWTDTFVLFTYEDFAWEEPGWTNFFWRGLRITFIYLILLIELSTLLFESKRGQISHWTKYLIG